MAEAAASTPHGVLDGQILQLHDCKPLPEQEVSHTLFQRMYGIRFLKANAGSLEPQGNLGPSVLIASTEVVPPHGDACVACGEAFVV